MTALSFNGLNMSDDERKVRIFRKENLSFCVL